MKAYISNQYGFSETGKWLLNNLFYPKFRELGIEILDPFEECSKFIDVEFLLNIADKTYSEVKQFWNNFNLAVTVTNNDLMNKSNCMIALLDGGHTIDDGVASEIGYYFHLNKPIFALRTDFRLADNLGTTINSQLIGYIGENNLFNSINKLFEALKNELH